MGIERQLKKVKIPGLSALALSACLTFLKPVLNLQNSRPIGRVLLSKIQSSMAAVQPSSWLGCAHTALHVHITASFDEQDSAPSQRKKEESY